MQKGWAAKAPGLGGISVWSWQTEFTLSSGAMPLKSFLSCVCRRPPTGRLREFRELLGPGGGCVGARAVCLKHAQAQPRRRQVHGEAHGVWRRGAFGWPGARLGGSGGGGTHGPGGGVSILRARGVRFIAVGMATTGSGLRLPLCCCGFVWGFPEMKLLFVRLPNAVNCRLNCAAPAPDALPARDWRSRKY